MEAEKELERIKKILFEEMVFNTNLLSMAKSSDAIEGKICVCNNILFRMNWNEEYKDWKSKLNLKPYEIEDMIVEKLFETK